MPNTGKITQIIGPVVDVRFPEGELPSIYTALSAENIDNKKVILEVAQHLGNQEVRTVAMTSTDGLKRGQQAVSTGGPINVPVGPKTLGYLFNVLGEPIDNKEAMPKAEHWPIHRLPPKFKDQSTKSEIFETGIKVIDLMAPFIKDGKVGLFGGGHVWPSGDQYLSVQKIGSVFYDISFDQMWEFFLKHPME